MTPRRRLLVIARRLGRVKRELEADDNIDVAERVGWIWTQVLQAELRLPVEEGGVWR